MYVYTELYVQGEDFKGAVVTVYICIFVMHRIPALITYLVTCSVNLSVHRCLNLYIYIYTYKGIIRIT